VHQPEPVLLLLLLFSLLLTNKHAQGPDNSVSEEEFSQDVVFDACVVCVCED
jgi:hypothetical protein